MIKRSGSCYPSALKIPSRAVLGKSMYAILKKFKRLGLEVVDHLNFNWTTTSKLDLISAR